MAKTTITGPVNDVNNGPFANKWIKFTLGQLGTDGTAGVTVAQSSDSVQTDASGDFTVDIWDNGESGKKSILEIKVEGSRPEYVIIPQGTASIELWDLIENYQAADTGPQLPVTSELFLAKSANLSDLSDAPTARTNLVLGNVDNTADLDKPISTATQTALDGKQTQSSVLDNTTASYTVAEENKLAGIETGAEVNDLDTLLTSDIGTTVQAYASPLNTIETTITDTDNGIPTSGAVVDYSQPKSQSTILVTQASDLSGTLDSTKVYYIDGVVDMGSQTIEVPDGGLSIIGSTFDVSQLVSSENSYDMFTSPVGGSGNLVLKDVGIETSGTGSSVFALTDATGFNAVEIKVVNFNNCTSMGYLNRYRQGLESGTGRFGGTPELEFRGTWFGGYRTDTTIARGMSNFTSLFKAGTGFTFGGRVILGMNCDLPATGAFCDFAPTNIDKDESLQLSDCRMTRSGMLNASDSTIYPNIDHTNVRCLWSDNAGLPNTTKYIKANVTAEVETTISLINTYYPLAGTFTIETSSHMNMPSNGEFQLLSGNGTYQISGDFVIDGTSNDVIDMRVTKSTDSGATWPTEIAHVRRQINSLVGGRDVAFFPLNFIATLQENDRVRIEVENTSGTGNVTAELDSYFILTAL